MSRASRSVMSKAGMAVRGASDGASVIQRISSEGRFGKRPAR